MFTVEGRALLNAEAPSTFIQCTVVAQKNVKKGVFGCEGKITLFSFPRIQRYVNSDAVCFSGAATEFLKCVC